jgi:dolichol-phosphate mannosyltransferase
MKKLISVAIPAYNEEEVLDELKKRLQNTAQICDQYDFEIIITENGSYDNTLAKLMAIHTEDPRFKIVKLSRNFGCDGGIAAALQYASGDAAVIMNADLQDPPEVIPEFIKKWEQGYEIVYGIIKRREGVSFTKRALSYTFYKVIHRLTNKAIPENVSDFRLIDKKVYSIINQMGERNKFLRGMIAWTGFRQTGVPITRPKRFAGEAKGNKFFPVLNVALNGIFSFSYFPLRLAVVLGFLVSALSFLMGGIELVEYFLHGSPVQGFTTTIVVILFLFGMQFFVIGIIGEYLARVYDEAKARPNFIVDTVIGF